MKNFICIAALLLFVSVAVKATNDDDSNESDDAAPEKNPSSTESKAGEAIKTLLQEKITQKFKEAANEVKGVLVKQLGDSLKSAHEAFNPPKEKEVGKKIGGAVGAKASESKAGAAKVHQNKANRHRKNSGPQAAPNKDHGPPIEAKEEDDDSFIVPPPPPKAPAPKPPVPVVPPPQPPPPVAPEPPPQPPPPVAPEPPPQPPPPDMSCCTPQNTQFMLSHLQIPVPPPPPPPPPPSCMPQCQQMCAPGCATQCCPPGKKKKRSLGKRKGTD